VERLWAPWRLEYVQSADKQDGCVFCRAAEGDDEEHLVVHRAEHAFVLLNKFPYSSGHLLVAPYRHGANFDDLDEADNVAPLTRRKGSTSAGTSAASPAPASPTTGICTSCRAGPATRTSCRCSAT